MKQRWKSKSGETGDVECRTQDKLNGRRKIECTERNAASLLVPPRSSDGSEWTAWENESSRQFRGGRPVYGGKMRHSGEAEATSQDMKSERCDTLHWISHFTAPWGDVRQRIIADKPSCRE